MRNLFKYNKFYSGKEPEFAEGDVFRIVVPLDEAYSYDFDQDNESQVATKGGEVATMGSKTATKKNDKVRCEVKNGKT